MVRGREDILSPCPLDLGKSVVGVYDISFYQSPLFANEPDMLYGEFDSQLKVGSGDLKTLQWYEPGKQATGCFGQLG